MIPFRSIAIALLALASLLGAPRTGNAADAYANCTGSITTVPVVIDVPGTWCVKQLLYVASASGSAIDIRTDNVTLDCNDFRLLELGDAATNQAYGIHASGRSNLTVRHCDVRGFYFGLYFQFGGAGDLVEDNRFEGNTHVGLQVDADDSQIRRNRVFDTGGSTVIADVYGIATNNSLDIMDNAVSGVAAVAGSSGHAIGIYTSSNVNGSIHGNRVRGLQKDGNGSVFAIGSFGIGYLSMRNNDVVGDTGASTYGIYCASSHGHARDNVISGFGTALSGCVNNVGNAIKP
jgi:hypothetical protein